MTGWQVGLMLLRLVLGALFIGHGTQKLAGWWGGRGLEATSSMVNSVGFPRPRLMARVLGLTETISGALLMLGFLTPFAAAGVIGVMCAAAIAVHWRNGVWNTDGGIEFPLTNIAAAGALAFGGAGTLSLDRAFGWHLAGLAWGGFSLLFGGLAAWFVLELRRLHQDRLLVPESDDDTLSLDLLDPRPVSTTEELEIETESAARQLDPVRSGASTHSPESSTWTLPPSATLGDVVRVVQAHDDAVFVVDDGDDGIRLVAAPIRGSDSDP